jgi:hypothetical protein
VGGAARPRQGRARALKRRALLRALAVVVAIAAATGAARPAAADPLFPVPVIGKARWGGDEGDVALAGFLAEMRALGVLYANRLTSWPDRRLGIEEGQPELVAARAGLVVHLLDAPFSLVVRADLAEPQRPFWDGPALALADSIANDVYLVWRPFRPLNLIVGRARVPFTRPRQFDEVDEPLGSPPFLVDRIAPDRRWGVAVHGDLGAASYFVGAYEDLDDLELRARTDDPSAGGALALLGHVEVTPRAPMMGSNPPGQVPGARGPLPTPRADPWFDTVRVSAGVGGLVRIREDGSQRLDVSTSLALKWRWTALVAEVITTLDRGDRRVGAHGELMLTPIDRIALTTRGEWDPGASGGGEWSLAGGITYHVTKDRRNKVALVSWLRRDRERDTPYDGWVVLLAASL